MRDIKDVQGEMMAAAEAAGLERFEMDVMGSKEGVRLGFSLATLISILAIIPKILPLIQELIAIINDLKVDDDKQGPTFHT